MDLKWLLFGRSAGAEASSHYPHSTQEWIPVRDVSHGMIITKDGRYVKILEVLPVNFRLKSPIEQQNIIYSFSAYLKVAPNNLQIRSITQKADIAGCEQRMWGFYDNEASENCRAMIEDNIGQVRYLAANEAVTRRFFLVFQYEHHMKARDDTPEAIAQRLWEEERTARQYLEMCGLEVLAYPYTDNFHLELLHKLLHGRSEAGAPPGAFGMTGMVQGVEDHDWEGSYDG